MKSAPLCLRGIHLREDGRIVLTVELAEPRMLETPDPLWPKPFVFSMPFVRPETAQRLIAQFEAANASPEADRGREANTFLSTLLGMDAKVEDVL